MDHFSTDRLPPRERLGVLHDFIGRHVARRQFTPTDGHELSIELSAFPLDEEITVGAARYSPISGERTRELIADGRDDYLMTVLDADHEIAIEGGAPIRVAAGGVMLVNEAMRSHFRLPAVRLSAVTLGYRGLLDRLPGLAGNSHYHIPAAAPGVALVRDYAAILHANSREAAGARRLTAAHLYDLVALMLEGHVKSDAARTRLGVGAARLEVAKRDILKRLREPDLAIGAVAQNQGVTARYLQRLFEAEGTTFSAFLRDCRLDLAHERLAAADGLGDSISAIAFDCGFSDLSHFNRSFRLRFGQAPSDVRAMTMLKRRQ